MDIGAKGENKVVLGELAGSFLSVATILANKAAEVALEENPLLRQIFEDAEILPDGVVALWMGQNHLITGVVETEQDIFIIWIFATHWQLDEEILRFVHGGNHVGMEELRDVAIDVDFVAEMNLDVEVGFVDFLLEHLDELAVFGDGAHIGAAVHEMRRSDHVGDAMFA